MSDSSSPAKNQNMLHPRPPTAMPDPAKIIADLSPFLPFLLHALTFLPQLHQVSTGILEKRTIFNVQPRLVEA